MSERTLTRLRLTRGTYEGLLSGAAAAPALEARLGGRVLAAARLEPHAERSGEFLVRVDLPAEVLDDGAAVVEVADPQTGDVLDRIGVLTGDALNEDLRAEVAMLRAELDLLKRAFRRHCQETGED